MKRPTAALAGVGAIVALVVGGFTIAASGDGATVNATCTPTSAVSQNAGQQEFSLTCDVPNPPPSSVTATVTATATATQTVTVSPTPTPTPTPTPSPTATSTTPAPTSVLGLGVYESGNTSPATFNGSKLAAASFYLNMDGSMPAAMTADAKAGLAIVAEVSSKVSGGTYRTWSSVAAGGSDPNLLTWRTRFAGLIATYGVKVYASFENEPDEKVSNGQAASGQTAAQYVSAADHFADVMVGGNSGVKPLVWLAGNKASATTFLPDITKFAAVSWDPYKTGTKATLDATGVLTAFGNKLNAAGWTADKVTRLITETGIQVDAFSNGGSYSVADQKTYWAQIPAAAAAAQVRYVIWFRANSGAHDFVPTDPSVDPAFASVASLN